MNRRVLLCTGVIAAALMLAGLLMLDRPLAEWLHASGFENTAFFRIGLAALDALSGMHVWYWLAGGVTLAVGAIGCTLRRHARWPRVFLAAGVVQWLCLATMILGKNHFGRLRPQQVFASGDWTHLWFAGGGSFPSGHSAFYFGLLLPLAAACPLRWLRGVLLAIPIYAVLARIDLAKHFLSDVAASALLAALYASIVALLARRWLDIAQPPAQH